MSDKDLTAYCGLYCGDCPRYKAKFSDLPDELLKDLEKIHFDFSFTGITLSEM
jgi:hypothetical protein